MGRLTEKQLEALIILARENGVAGTEWYFPSSLGGRPTVRALNRRGFVEPNKNEGAGLLYRITESGRLAVAQSDPRPEKEGSR